MNLSESPDHAVLRVTALALAPAVVLRLREIGLRDGSVVRVWRRTPFGGRVVGVGGARIAIDGETARRVHVEAVSA